MASNVKWIKMMVGMFDGMSFKKIKRAKIGGESYRDKLTAVWFELMDFAGKCNHEGAFISPSEIPFTDLSDIAVMIDRDEEELKLCMSFYINEGMVTVIDDIYHLSNWAEYQNKEGLDKIREQNRLRQKAWYDRQKALPNASNAKPNAKPNVRLTDIEEEREEELESEKDNLIYTSVIDYLNQKAGTNYRASSKKTRSLIHARVKEGFTLDDFKVVIDKKCTEWLKTDMAQYLRPENLFGTKFEGYLNAKVTRSTQRPQQATQQNEYNSFMAQLAAMREQE